MLKSDRWLITGPKEPVTDRMELLIDWKALKAYMLIGTKDESLVAGMVIEGNEKPPSRQHRLASRLRVSKCLDIEKSWSKPRDFGGF